MLHNEIRTRAGEKAPAYEPFYKIKELNKAKSRKSSSLNKTASILPWVERGPGNVAGRTRSLVADPANPEATWFAGSVGGGIWKTTDAGVTWINKTSDLPNLAISTMAMSNSNNNIIYAGTGEGFGNVGSMIGDGILKSTDRGDTWEQLTSTTINTEFEIINRIIVDPLDENTLLAGANTGTWGPVKAGIFKSTNGGNTWMKVYNSGGNPVEQLVADPVDFNNLYGTVKGVGVLKSTDGGDTWVSSSEGLGSGGRFELAVSPVDANRLYLSADNFPTSDFYVSYDGGAAWKIANESVGDAPAYMGGQGFYDNTIAAHPYDVDIAYVGGIDIWRVDITTSTRGGNSIPSRTTTPISDGYGQYGGPYIHVDHHNITLVPLDATSKSFLILNGNDGGIAYSTNKGSTWKSPNDGYNSTQFYGIDKKPGANEYIGGTQDNGSFRSAPGENANAGTSYSLDWGGDGFEAAWHNLDPNKIVVSSQFNNIARSLDGGQSYESAINGIDDEGPFVSKIAKSPSDPDLLFTVGSSGVWRSDDFAGSWTSSPINSGWNFSGIFDQVAVSLADPQIVWAGVSMDENGDFHVSTDGGITFNRVNDFQDVVVGRVTGLDTHPLDPSTAFAVFAAAGVPKVIKTTDLGNTWEDLSGFVNNSVSSNGFPNVVVYCLLVMPYDPNIIWVGTEIGLFVSSDNGASWSFADNGLPAVSIWDMKIVDDQVVVATHGRGIWSVTLPELAGYMPPAVILSPRMLDAKHDGLQTLTVETTLRSEYDSTQIIVNDTPVFTADANTTGNFSYNVPFPILETQDISVYVKTFKDNRSYRSPGRTLTLFSYASPRNSFADDFSVISEDYLGNDFQIRSVFFFSGDQAIHTIHPYNDNSEIIITLSVPITVANENAFLNYDDIAIVEPGDPGTKFGDFEFWDYVVVEGSLPGGEWVPLADGYDARLHQPWLDVYNAQGLGKKELYKKHNINLLDTFNPGDVILIRFRLSADEFVNGWGWAIDNLEIQETLTDVDEITELPITFNLEQNYPNPFNPSTTIKFALPSEQNVSIKVFDAIGREVETLISERLTAGYHNVIWNADRFASGVYYYRIQAGEFVSTKKLMLLK